MPLRVRGIQAPSPRVKELKESWEGLVSPEEPGKVYIGPNVNWGGVTEFLNKAMGALDTTGGMMPAPVAITRAQAMKAFLPKGRVSPEVGEQISQTLQLIKGIPRRTLRQLETISNVRNPSLKGVGGKYSWQPKSIEMFNKRAGWHYGDLPSTLAHEASHQSLRDIMEGIARKYNIGENYPSYDRYRQVQNIIGEETVEGLTEWLARNAVAKKAGVQLGPVEFGHGPHQRDVYDYMRSWGPETSNPYMKVYRILNAGMEELFGGR